MSELPTEKPETPLSFDRAEYSDTAATTDGVRCAQCSTPLNDNYFTVGRLVVCQTCSALIAAALRGGSPAKRTIVALVAGIAASLVGAGIYYAVAAITGYELGLIAIVVGLLVGAAVRWGCERRGGWFYQTMAILLTYFSIALSDSIFAVQYIMKHESNTAANKRAAELEGKTTSKPDALHADGEGDSEEADTDHEPATLRGTHGIVRVVIAFGMTFFWMLALPVIVGMGSPISFLILAIALWEAWKLNKRLMIAIAGPFAISHAPPSSPA